MTKLSQMIEQGVSDELEFRVFDPSREFDLQRSLFLDAFPETAGTAQAGPAHYNWKFKRFPDKTPSYEYGAYAGGRLVGYYAAIPYPYLLHGKTYRAAMVCDVMTHSSMRGKGVFTKLGRFAVDQMSQAGLDIAFGYPVRPEVIPGHLKVGWKISGDLPMFVRIARLNSVLRQRSARALVPLANLCCKAYGAVLSPRSSATQISTRPLNTEAFLSRPGCEEFLNSLGGPGGTLLKTPEFIRWRYGAPGTEYAVLTSSRNGRPVAAAFVRKAELKGIPTLAVLDLIAGKDREALCSLFRGLHAYCSEHAQEMIAMMVTPRRARELGLVKFGYLRSPYKFQLISRPLSDRAGELENISAEDFQPMWVDSDDL